MGDYSKLIVSCNVKKEAKEELQNKIAEFRIGVGVSAYQSEETIIHIKENTHDENELDVILVGQNKWGTGHEEFCSWLKPHVTQGSGENEVFAMSFSEYSDTPRIWKLREN